MNIIKWSYITNIYNIRFIQTEYIINNFNEWETLTIAACCIKICCSILIRFLSLSIYSICFYYVFSPIFYYPLYSLFIMFSPRVGNLRLNFHRYRISEERPCTYPQGIPFPWVSSPYHQLSAPWQSSQSTA